LSARVDADPSGVVAENTSVAFAATLPATLAIDPDDQYGGHALPSDHPAWMKDTLSISQRTRALIARLKPVVVKVVAYWEHRVRSIVVGKRRLSVDASGSYRLD
jgi:hypothetical protein